MPSEKKLIKRAKHDQDAFLELYNNYYPKIYAYLLVRTKDREISEDILQETFIKGLRALKNYEYQGKSFGAWLFRIASNEMVSHWRKANKTTSYGDDQTLESKTQAVASPEEELIKKEDVLEENEQYARLMAALDKLPADERELVVLKYISKLSYKDIAVIQKNKPAILAVRLHRALGKLKKII